MRTYTAHLKPDRDPVLLREGWSWGALFFGPLWLLACHAWIPALIEAAALVLIVVLAPPPTRPLLTVGLCVLNGLLGRDMTRWSLARSGYALGHVVLAPGPDAALLRLYTARPDLAR